MRFLLLLAALGGAYFLHGRYVFSQDAMGPWLSTQAQRALEGDARACDLYDERLQFTLVEEKRGGRNVIQGGKTEMCDYLMRSAQALKTAQATAEPSMEGLTITPQPFPWTQALVSYSHRIRILTRNRPASTAGYANTITVVRTLHGPKIIQMHSVVYADAPPPAAPRSSGTDPFSKPFSNTY